MHYWKVAQVAFKLFDLGTLKTGGKTGCDKCNCYIENREYYENCDTKKKCPKCNHLYSAHHMFL